MTNFYKLSIKFKLGEYEKISSIQSHAGMGFQEIADRNTSDSF
ncbi:hypothetical protein [Microcoleus asticus]|nr:hypothetical protein [Microcoleus asticus]